MYATDCLPVRQVTRQGQLTRISATQPKMHAGGGKRGLQFGHATKASRRMHNFLLTCHTPAFIIWLTFPGILGPKAAVKHLNSFLGRLERAVNHKLGVVIKMELQERLAPEFCLLVWGATVKEVTYELVGTLWEKTIKAKGRIKIDTSFDWEKLSSYVSKEISVRDGKVFIGKKTGVRVVDAVDTNDLSKEHKTQKKFKRLISSVTPSSQYREWESYTGHYQWKRHKDLIPRYPVLDVEVPDDEIAVFRHEVNNHRINFFVGVEDGFSLKGDRAVRAAASISPDLLYEHERASLNSSSPGSVDAFPCAATSLTAKSSISLPESYDSVGIPVLSAAFTPSPYTRRQNHNNHHGVEHAHLCNPADTLHCSTGQDALIPARPCSGAGQAYRLPMRTSTLINATVCYGELFIPPKRMPVDPRERIPESGGQNEFPRSRV